MEVPFRKVVPIVTTMDALLNICKCDVSIFCIEDPLYTLLIGAKNRLSIQSYQMLADHENQRILCMNKHKSGSI